MPIQLDAMDRTVTHEMNPPARGGEPLGGQPDRKLRRALAERIGDHRFDMWFTHASLRVDGPRLEVSTDSQFAADWISSHFVGELSSAAEQALGKTLTIDVRAAGATICDGDSFSGQSTGDESGQIIPSGTTRPRGRHEHANNSPNRPDAAALRAGGNGHGQGQESRPARRVPALRRLDDMVVGTCNKLAHSAARQLAEDADARCISPLFIHGDCGVGKTHLLQGICRRYVELTGRASHVRYVTGEQFTNEFITAIRTNSIDGFRSRIRKLELLAIDDIHFLSSKTRTQTEFLYTLDAIDLAGARVVLASDNHPHHIRRFSQALVSRFLSGMVVKVDPPDRVTRLELIRRLVASQGLRINDAAAQSIADQCVGSVRELEGAVVQLAAYRTLLQIHEPSASGTPGNGPQHSGAASDSRGEIGLILTQQLFKDQAGSLMNGSSIVRLASVMEGVCERVGVARADLLGSSRHRRVVLARALVVYLSREMTTHSFPEIAQALGRTNHSTVHTANQRLRRQLENNECLEHGGEQTSLKDLAEQLRRDILLRGRKAH